jgi:class 3 adenylate cyclase
MEHDATAYSEASGNGRATASDLSHAGPVGGGGPAAALRGSWAEAPTRASAIGGRAVKTEPARSPDGTNLGAALPFQPAGTVCTTHGEQIRRLKRFLAPQVAQFALSCDETELRHVKRREITVLFCDLRGFTAFAEVAAPEDVMEVLRQYHHTLGSLVTAYDGTLERFTGDGVMVYFDQPAVETQAAKAVRMALRVRERVGQLCAVWRRWGYDLDLGIGIALGFASVGTIGFEGRYDYAAIGPVTNLASRLCEHAAPGQILISQRLYASIQHTVVADPVGSLTLGGFHGPVPAYSVRGLQASAAEDPAP